MNKSHILIARRLLRLGVITVVLFYVLSPLQAQQYRWQRARIPMDSIQPHTLEFVDSLVGYFGGVVPKNHNDGYLDSVDFLKKNNHHYDTGYYYWFRTTDGGANWTPLKFDGLYKDTDRLSYASANGYPRIGFPSWSSVLMRGSGAGKLSTWDTGNSILLSTDQGGSWKVVVSDGEHNHNIHELIDVFGRNSWLMGEASILGAYYSSIQLTTDGGKTYTSLQYDSVFSSTFNWDTADAKVDSYWDMACSSPSGWSVLFRPSNSTPGTNPYLDSMRRGFVTLWTTDAGTTWARSHYYLPWDSSIYLYGSLQYVKGTPNLYYLPVTGGMAKGEGPRVVPNPLTEPFGMPTHSVGGVSYLYSSDMGQTWTADTSYGYRRRAFEPTDAGEVWMTVSKESSIIDSSVSPPKNNPDLYAADFYASWIVHTTDLGKTWSIDSTTLDYGDIVFDGRIVTFKGPRHGWIAASRPEETYVYYLTQPTKSVESDGSEYTKSVSLYPNPVTDILHIERDLPSAITKIKVYDIVGKEHNCEYEITSKHSVTLDCRVLSPGSYMVKIYDTKGDAVTRSFVISK